MHHPSFLKFLKYSALIFGALMAAGIVTVMFLSRGTDEDITGIVALGLLGMIASGIVAIITAFPGRRAKRLSDSR